jgi:hypothetical protein
VASAFGALNSRSRVLPRLANSRTDERKSLSFHFICEGVESVSSQRDCPCGFPESEVPLIKKLKKKTLPCPDSSSLNRNCRKNFNIKAFFQSAVTQKYLQKITNYLGEFFLKLTLNHVNEVLEKAIMVTFRS